MVHGLPGIPSFSGCSAPGHIGAGAVAAAHGRGDIGQNRVTPHPGCQLAPALCPSHSDCTMEGWAQHPNPPPLPGEGAAVGCPYRV